MRIFWLCPILLLICVFGYSTELSFLINSSQSSIKSRVADSLVKEEKNLLFYEERIAERKCLIALFFTKEKLSSECIIYQIDEDWKKVLSEATYKTFKSILLNQFGIIDCKIDTRKNFKNDSVSFIEEIWKTHWGKVRLIQTFSKNHLTKPETLTIEFAKNDSLISSRMFFPDKTKIAE